MRGSSAMGTVVWRGARRSRRGRREFDLEPVAGLVAAEEGGGFVLVEAGDDGEVGARAGAEVGAFDEDGDCGPVISGEGEGRGRGGGGAGVRRAMRVATGAWGLLASAMRVATAAGPIDSWTISSRPTSPKTRTCAAGTQPAVPSAR